MAGQRQGGGRKPDGASTPDPRRTSTFRPTVEQEARHSGLRPRMRESVAPVSRNATSLTAFAHQMGVQRRRSTAKMRAIQEADFTLLASAGRVVDDALGVAAGEHVMLVVDRAHRDWGIAFEVALAERRVSVMRLTVEDLGALPLPSCPDVVHAGLRDSAVVISAFDDRSAEPAFRRELAQAASRIGARHLRFGGASREAILSSLTMPCSRTFESVARVARLLRDATRVRVRSSHGTDLTIDLDRFAPPVVVGAPPRAGEPLSVPFGRVEMSAASLDGTYVADASSGELLGGHPLHRGTLADAVRGGLATRHVRLEVSRGSVVKVHGVEAPMVRAIEEFATRSSSHRRIGRWMLGANVGCSTLLGEVCHDVNRPGIHLTMGSGRISGGAEEAPVLAFATSRADVDVDGQALIRAGRFVRW